MFEGRLAHIGVRWMDPRGHAMAPRKQSGALPSNAGDQYHFVYAARRMLHMLHPRLDLKLIQMEGVAPGDAELGGGPGSFLAVDVTEYYGGDDSGAADRIVLTQVKYSPLHPTRRWTLSRLCARQRQGKSPGSQSVIRKLADSFHAFYGELGDQGISKLTVRLHTNQPLLAKLKKEIVAIRDLLRDKSPKKFRSVLQGFSCAACEVVDRLKRGTSLSYRELGHFLCQWDLDGFGQASLQEHKGLLFNETTAYRAGEAGLYLDRLCQAAQDHSTAGNQQSIRPDKVYAYLRVQKRDFLPAPYEPEAIPHLQSTQSVADLSDLVERTDRGIIVVHGTGGSGKSVTIQQFASSYAGGDRVVVYDCWAAGAGLQPGSERYPAEVFLAQVINEIDHLYHTGILGNAKDSYRDLAHRLDDVLQWAARKAESNRHRLVVAVDAADNAVRAYKASPIGGQSFVPLLSRLGLPSGCVLIVSARTENLPLLGDFPNAARLEVSGFTEEETLAYFRAHVPDASDELVAFAHRRTGGCPRTLAKIMGEGEKGSTGDWMGLIDAVGRASLDEYYEEAFGCVREDLPLAPKVLATLMVMKRPWDPADLAGILERDWADIEQVIARMYFGLRYGTSGSIEPTDQDFLDFAHANTEKLSGDAHRRIAEFCTRSYTESAYAEQNLAYHLYQAGEYSQLVDRLLADHLDRRKRLEAPHQEDVLPDIQYGLKAALKLERFGDSLQLLASAGAVLRGRDVFSEQLRDFVPVAVQSGYYRPIVDHMYEHPEAEGFASEAFEVACCLRRGNIDLELAADLLRRGHVAAWRPQQEHWAGQREERGGYHDNDVRNIAEYIYLDSGLQQAFKWLTALRPQELVIPAYAQVARKAAESGHVAPTKAISGMALNDAQAAAVAAGVFVGHKKLPRSVSDALLSTVLDGLEAWDVSIAEVLRLIGDVALAAVKRRCRRRDLEKLVRVWAPAPPGRVAGNWRGEIEDLYDFLRCEAVRNVLLTGSYNPQEFTPEPPQKHLTEDQKQHYEQEKRRLVRQASRHFPATVARVSALAARDENSVVATIEQGLSVWPLSRDSWYRDGGNPTWEYGHYARECLEAVLELPGDHERVVRRICCAGDGSFREVGHVALCGMADVLSRDARYSALAEELIDHCASLARSPVVPASDSVSQLLSLCPIAARLDDTLATRLFEASRKEAAKWEPREDSHCEAILRTGKEAQRTRELNKEHAARLAELFIHVAGVAQEDDGSHRVHDALRLVGSIDGVVGLKAQKEAVSRGCISLGMGLLSAVEGMLEAGCIAPAMAWPVVHMASDDWAKWEFLEELVDELKGTRSVQSFQQALSLWAHDARRQITGRGGPDPVRSVVRWATDNGLAHMPVIQEARQLLVALDSAQRAYGSAAPIGYGARKPDASTRKARSVLKKGWREAFAYWCGLEQNECVKTDLVELGRMVATVLPHLTSSQMAELAQVVMGAESDGRGSYILSLLVRILGKIRAPGPCQATTLSAARPFVARHFSELLLSSPSNGGLSGIMSCAQIDVAERLRILLSPAVEQLPNLTASQVYKLIGLASPTLSGEDAREVFRSLLDHAMAGVPHLEALHGLGDRTCAQEHLMDYLGLLLGHPDSPTCIAAVYTWIDMALQLPEQVLPHLLSIARDEAAERWMTAREWALFVCWHLAIRAPRLLVPHSEEFVRHALDKSFPHARIRETAKQCALAIESVSPGAISRRDIKAVRCVNEPLETVGRPKRAPYDKPWRSRRSGTRFCFDFTDTMPYWFSPLAHCFDLHRCHVADAAEEWIVDKWNLSNGECDQRDQALAADWSLTSHRQGSFPRVLRFTQYVEHHALHVVAGQFADTRPAVGTDSGYRSWADWLHYRARPLDPVLTSKLIGSPPPLPDHFDVRPDFGEWARRDRIEEFRAELLPPDQPQDWVVVLADRNASFDDRVLAAEVESCLVPAETAPSLARAIEGAEPSDRIDLATLSLSYMTSMSELDQALGDAEDSPHLVGDSPRGGLFRMVPWVAQLGVEEELGAYDPRWPSRGRLFPLPSGAFVASLGLTRETSRLDYRDSSGNLVIKCHLWDDLSGIGRDQSQRVHGYRLLFRRDTVAQYLQSLNLCALFTVRLRRQRPYRWHPSEHQEGHYDLGVVKAFILHRGGRLVRC